MLSFPASVRIYVAVGVTDMRKSFDGLCAATQNVLAEDPFSGHVFAFCNRRRDRLIASLKSRKEAIRDLIRYRKWNSILDAIDNNDVLPIGIPDDDGSDPPTSPEPPPPTPPSPDNPHPVDHWIAVMWGAPGPFFGSGWGLCVPNDWIRDFGEKWRITWLNPATGEVESTAYDSQSEMESALARGHR